MKRKIAIFTTTRAEFGILFPLINQMSEDEELEPLLFAGGAHLVSAYGNTIDEIADHGLCVQDTFDYASEKDDRFSLATSLGVACRELARTC